MCTLQFQSWLFLIPGFGTNTAPWSLLIICGLHQWLCLVTRVTSSEWTDRSKGETEGKKNRGRKRHQLGSTGTFGVLLASERAVHQPLRLGKAPSGKQQKSHKAVIYSPAHMSGLEARGSGQVESTECFATSQKNGYEKSCINTQKR